MNHQNFAGMRRLDRRRFVQSIAASVGCATTGTGTLADDNASRRVRIVLRSSWQTVNIGDIAHTPGVLVLLEKYLPDVEVRLWPSVSRRKGCRQMA